MLRVWSFVFLTNIKNRKIFFCGYWIDISLLSRFILMSPPFPAFRNFIANQYSCFQYTSACAHMHGFSFLVYSIKHLYSSIFIYIHPKQDFSIFLPIIWTLFIIMRFFLACRHLRIVTYLHSFNYIVTILIYVLYIFFTLCFSSISYKFFSIRNFPHINIPRDISRYNI